MADSGGIASIIAGLNDGDEIEFVYRDVFDASSTDDPELDGVRASGHFLYCNDGAVPVDKIVEVRVVKRAEKPAKRKAGDFRIGEIVEYIDPTCRIGDEQLRVVGSYIRGAHVYVSVVDEFLNDGEEWGIIAEALQLAENQIPLACISCGKNAAYSRIDDKYVLAHVNDLISDHTAILSPSKKQAGKSPIISNWGEFVEELKSDLAAKETVEGFFTEEPPAGSGWFADKYPGVHWTRLIRSDKYSEQCWWGRTPDGYDMWREWNDLRPGRPAVPFPGENIPEAEGE